jgi:hypothetical protein
MSETTPAMLRQLMLAGPTVLLGPENIQLQMSPPHVHLRNAAERTIQMFKNHFIAGLCSMDPNFSLRLWDKLFPQETLTINRLWQSRINPRLSAYYRLNGHYYFSRAPMAPPGTRVIAHEKPDHLGTSWAPAGRQLVCIN